MVEVSSRSWWVVLLPGAGAKYAPFSSSSAGYALARLTFQRKRGLEKSLAQRWRGILDAVAK